MVERVHGGLLGDSRNGFIAQKSVGRRENHQNLMDWCTGKRRKKCEKCGKKKKAERCLRVNGTTRLDGTRAKVVSLH